MPISKLCSCNSENKCDKCIGSYELQKKSKKKYCDCDQKCPSCKNDGFDCKCGTIDKEKSE